LAFCSELHPNAKICISGCIAYRYALRFDCSESQQEAQKLETNSHQNSHWPVPADFDLEFAWICPILCAVCRYSVAVWWLFRLQVIANEILILAQILCAI
jgi:hypothetical protein